MSSFHSRIAVSSLPSAPSVRAPTGWQYLPSSLHPPYGRQPAWRARWTRHAEVLAPQPDGGIFPSLWTFRMAVNAWWVSVMASVVVTVCFRELLCDVCQKYSLLAPRYGVPVENDGLISVYVEVEISRGDSVAETIRIWGNPFSDIDQSEEDAALRAVAKLRDEYTFEHTERRELMGNIEKCSEVLRRPSIRGIHPASSGEGSGEDPATPSGYRG
uniref:Uncharacterized protein n=1 Tax=Ananas comosus var. bracteatus TaxID=296719 RepID=A0A6V7NHT1_ANACO|nr:unnamed protein product [Ananas comosus var. bracteatus]